MMLQDNFGNKPDIVSGSGIGDVLHKIPPTRWYKKTDSAFQDNSKSTAGRILNVYGADLKAGWCTTGCRGDPVRHISHISTNITLYSRTANHHNWPQRVRLPWCTKRNTADIVD